MGKYSPSYLVGTCAALRSILQYEKIFHAESRKLTVREIKMQNIQ